LFIKKRRNKTSRFVSPVINKINAKKKII